MRYLVLLAILGAFIISCDRDKMESKNYTFKQLDEISDEAWKMLSEQKFFFGHQSVGNNIIKGMNAILKNHKNAHLEIVETNMIGNNLTGIFAHYKVGKNSDPQLKMDSFLEILDNPENKGIDTVFLKLCFVDIGADTDVNELFSYYKKTVSKIKTNHPDLTIIHFTVPLTQLRTTWKTKIKELIGKENIWEYDHIIKKNIYNQLLVNEYSGIDPIFDIASIESTFPDGRRNSFTRNGNTYYTLISEYSSDGAHLNDLGQQIVAEKLLLFLINL